MRAAAVARRYARALFELAEERGLIDAIASGIGAAVRTRARVMPRRRSSNLSKTSRIAIR